jgi:hypothetical protein
MKETFLTQFFKKGTKAHKKSADCFKAGDYMGFLDGYFEEGYYNTLAYAVNGDDHEVQKERNGKTVIDTLIFSLRIDPDGKSRATQALKKIGKLEKQPEIEVAIKHFIENISADFFTLSKKSTEIYRTLMSMGSWERIEKGLTNNVNNEVDAVDKLFIEDKAVMAVMNRLKASGIINKLVKEVREILQ